MEAYGIGSVLAVPLPARGRAMGIALYHKSAPSSFSHEHVEFAARAGSGAAPRELMAAKSVSVI